MQDERRSLRIGAACGFLSVVTFSILYSVAAFQDPGYEFLENYLSDLGVGPAAWAFNSALILSGMLMVAFASLGMRPLLGASLVSRAGWFLLALSGVLLVNIGIFTENSGDIHFVFSVAFFITLLVTLGILAYAFYRSRSLGRTASALCGVAFAGGLVLLAIGLNPLAETLAVLTALVWGTLISVLMMAEASGMRIP